MKLFLIIILIIICGMVQWLAYRPHKPKPGVQIPVPLPSSSVKIGTASVKIGTASWYSYKSCRREGTSGAWTVSGEKFDENDFTCALRSRSYGGLYRVVNLSTGKSVVVRHNDLAQT